MPAVLYEKKGHIAYITINRPEAMNALNREVVQGLSEAWMDFREDRELWVAILTGAGDRAFSAGADLKEMSSHSTEDFSEEFWYGGPRNLLNFRDFELFKPVIAAINGYCLAGAFTMMLATDIRVAAEHAKFGYFEAKRGGIMVGSGGPERLPRQVPYAIAMRMLLTGEMIDAQEAYRIGLINEVVPLPKLMPTAETIANQICENAPLGVRGVKEAALRGQDMPLSMGQRFEQLMGRILRETHDAQEGPRAFAEKRKPIYKGK